VVPCALEVFLEPFELWGLVLASRRCRMLYMPHYVQRSQWSSQYEVSAQWRQYIRTMCHVAKMENIASNATHVSLMSLENETDKKISKRQKKCSLVNPVSSIFLASKFIKLDVCEWTPSFCECANVLVNVQRLMIGRLECGYEDVRFPPNLTFLGVCDGLFIPSEHLPLTLRELIWLRCDVDGSVTFHLYHLQHVSISNGLNSVETLLCVVSA